VCEVSFLSAQAATRLEFERRLLACPRLPTLPAAALRILELCRDEEVDLWQIADAIASDPALAARILRSANSATLAAHGKVSTLTRAVALLGSKTVTAIALSFGLLRNRHTDRTGGFDSAGFWRRAVFSALAARAAAEITAPVVDPEEAFVAGLLQDLGVLALAELFQHEYGSLCARAGGDHPLLAELERDAWGADHADASALLARTWHLPASLQFAIGASHEPLTETAFKGEEHLARCTAMSGRIADIWVARPGQETDRTAEAGRNIPGLSPAAFEGILARMALTVPEAAVDFEIDLGGPERIEQVLLEAQTLLHLRAPVSQASLPASVQAALHSGDGLASPLHVSFEYARTRATPIAFVVFHSPASDEGAPLAPLVRSRLRSIDLLQEHAGTVLALLPDTDLAGGRTFAELVVEQLEAAGRRVHAGVASQVPDAEATLESLHEAAAGAAARSQQDRQRVVTAPASGSNGAGGGPG